MGIVNFIPLFNFTDNGKSRLISRPTGFNTIISEKNLFVYNDTKLTIEFTTTNISLRNQKRASGALKKPKRHHDGSALKIFYYTKFMILSSWLYKR